MTSNEGKKKKEEKKKKVMMLESTREVWQEMEKLKRRHEIEIGLMKDKYESKLKERDLRHAEELARHVEELNNLFEGYLQKEEDEDDDDDEKQNIEKIEGNGKQREELCTNTDVAKSVEDKMHKKQNTKIQLLEKKLEKRDKKIRSLKEKLCGRDDKIKHLLNKTRTELEINNKICDSSISIGTSSYRGDPLPTHHFSRGKYHSTRTKTKKSVPPPDDPVNSSSKQHPKQMLSGQHIYSRQHYHSESSTSSVQSRSGTEKETATATATKKKITLVENNKNNAPVSALSLQSSNSTPTRATSLSTITTTSSSSLFLSTISNYRCNRRVVTPTPNPAAASVTNDNVNHDRSEMLNKTIDTSRQSVDNRNEMKKQRYLFSLLLCIRRRIGRINNNNKTQRRFDDDDDGNDENEDIIKTSSVRSSMLRNSATMKIDMTGSVTKMNINDDKRPPLLLSSR